MDLSCAKKLFLERPSLDEEDTSVAEEPTILDIDSILSVHVTHLVPCPCGVFWYLVHSVSSFHIGIHPSAFPSLPETFIAPDCREHSIWKDMFPKQTRESQILQRKAMGWKQLLLWGQLERALDASPPSQGLSAERCNGDPASPTPGTMQPWRTGL